MDKNNDLRVRMERILQEGKQGVLPPESEHGTPDHERDGSEVRAFKIDTPNTREQQMTEEMRKMFECTTEMMITAMRHRNQDSASPSQPKKTSAIQKIQFRATGVDMKKLSNAQINRVRAAMQICIATANKTDAERVVIHLSAGSIVVQAEVEADAPLQRTNQ